MKADRNQHAQWARLGAVVRLAQLRDEVAEILRRYPELRRAGPLAASDAVKTGRRRHMSAQARKAMSEGMRKYWAKRKGQEKGAKAKTA